MTKTTSAVKKQKPVQQSKTISRNKLQEIVGKYLLDQDFQRTFQANPRLAVESAGIALTEFEYDTLNKIRSKLDEYINEPDVQKLRKDMIMYVDRRIQAKI